MIHEMHAIRRVLTTAYRRIVKSDFRQEVLVMVYDNKRWSAEFGASSCETEWLSEVDHALQQFQDFGFDSMDSIELCRQMVIMVFGDDPSIFGDKGHCYRLQFDSTHVAAALQKFIDLTPKDISADQRIRDALILLSPLEQKFLSLLASHGDGERVGNDIIAHHCWSDAVEHGNPMPSGACWLRVGHSSDSIRHLLRSRNPHPKKIGELGHLLIPTRSRNQRSRKGRRPGCFEQDPSILGIRRAHSGSPLQRGKVALF